MAREAGFTDGELAWHDHMLEAFEALVRADEREACAKVCDDLPAPSYVSRDDATVWDVATLECGDAIRAQQALDKKAENARELGLDYEPVGEIGWGGSVNWHKTIPEFGTDLYTTPPAQSTWVGLTDEEISQLWIGTAPYFNEDDYARAIEAKLKAVNGFHSTEKDT
jgi:hypothetical protein